MKAQFFITFLASLFFMELGSASMVEP